MITLTCPVSDPHLPSYQMSEAVPSCSRVSTVNQQHSLCRVECLQDETSASHTSWNIDGQRKQKEVKQKIQKAKKQNLMSSLPVWECTASLWLHCSLKSLCGNSRHKALCRLFSLVLPPGNLELSRWCCFNCTAVSLIFGFCKWKAKTKTYTFKKTKAMIWNSLRWKTSSRNGIKNF